MATYTLTVASKITIVVDYTDTQTDTTYTRAYNSWTLKHSSGFGTPSGSSGINSTSSYCAAATPSYLPLGISKSNIASGVKSITFPLSGKQHVFSKTHAAQSLSIRNSYNVWDSTVGTWSQDKTVSITIPAKTTYTVTLDANGGSGGTTSLTKWHGEPLDLTAGFTAPTRQGYLFYGWSATQEDAEAGVTVSTYTVDSDAPFYACWKPAIENARITSIDVVRVDNSSSTTESDDGEYCYGRVGFSMEGEAAGTVGIVVTIDPPILDSNDNPITPSFTFTKQAGLPLSDVASFHVPDCDLSTKYLFIATATFANSDYADQVINDSTLGDYLSIAFFTWDALADGFPGQRPGHGFAFGQQSVIEGLCVAMDLMVRPWAGVIQMFAGSTPPAGWLLCDGSAVSRTTYATLYAAIGDIWGAGDGSTTFNLPDLRGRAPIGAGTGSGLTARTLGGTGGSEDAVIPYHRHAMGAHTHNAWTDGDQYLGNDSSIARRTVASGSGATNQLYSAGVTSRHASTGAMNGSPYTAYAGSNGNTDNANMQPYAVVNYIIHTGKTS